MAEIIRTKATIAKRALTSFISQGALNIGFWGLIVIDFWKFQINPNKKATESGFLFG